MIAPKPVESHLASALARLAVLETVVAKLAIDDTTLREGLRIAIGDIVADVAAADQEAADMAAARTAGVSQ